MKEKQRSINALKDFINNIYLAEDLSPKQSIKNLEESLIELIDYSSRKHIGNGILITEDGYFLTAYHCVKNSINRNLTLIKDYKNKKYNIEKICEKNKKEDLVLAKAEIQKTPLSKKYKFYNTNSLKEYYLWNFPVNSKTRWNGKVENNYGLIIHTNAKNKMSKTNKTYENQLMAQMKTKDGDSGGIIVDKEGRLIGIHSNGSETFTGDSKVFSALDLVQKYINKLEKQNSLTNFANTLKKVKRNLIQSVEDLINAI